MAEGAGSGAGSAAGGGETLQPVRGNQRVVVLDALRGVAIFGILLVNIELFYGPDFFLLQAGERVLSGVDLVLGFLVSLFLQAKFYSIFSFLFGLGLVMQTMRAEERGRSSARLLSRRLGVLALFGLAHGVLIWSGDILLTYALLGFVFLLFRRRRPRTLLIWAGVFLFVPPLLLLLAGLGALFATTSPEGAEAIAQAGAGQAESIRSLADSAQTAYGSGSYLDMVAQRLSELLYMFTGLFFIGPSILGMFLVGGAVARAGWLRDLDAHRAGIRRAILIGLLAGLPPSLVAAYALTLNPGGASGTALIWVGQSCQLLGAPLLALAYAGTRPNSSAVFRVLLLAAESVPSGGPPSPTTSCRA